MDKPLRDIICYSNAVFNDTMNNNKWIETPPIGVSCISIQSQNESNYAERWFKNNNDRIFNLNIDSSSPFWFKGHEAEYYNNALNLYLNNEIDESNAYFNHTHTDEHGIQHNIHLLNYEEAFNLVNWIDTRIKEDNTIYIHCGRGDRRSQGVVKYIADTYKNDYDIKLNPYNPNDQYNKHITMMLKRVYKTLKNN